MLIGYHAPHEQFPPGALLEYVQQAERAGFQAAMCSDHLEPWSHRQGHSGFAWSWLGAALQATSLSFGTVCAPGQRYHPAIVAQAAATLAEMFPGRFWLSLGSGELLNEHVTGDPWPPKHDRERRLLECVDIMRRLFAGERVTQRGLVNVDHARIWVQPAQPPPLYGAALTPETAAWCGEWADGIAVAAAEVSQTRQVIEAFREHGGDGKPVLLQVEMGYAATDGEALDEAHDQWRHALLGPEALPALPSPRAFDAASATVPRDEVNATIRVSADPGDHVRWLEELAALEPDAIYVHNPGRDQQGFIAMYGREVLPHFAHTATVAIPGGGGSG